MLMLLCACELFNKHMPMHVVLTCECRAAGNYIHNHNTVCVTLHPLPVRPEQTMVD